MGELEGPVRAKVCRDMSDYAGKLVDKARESWEKAGSYEAKGLLPEAASERDKWRDLIYAIQMVCDTINYAKKADGSPNPGNPNSNPKSGGGGFTWLLIPAAGVLGLLAGWLRSR